MTMEFLVGGLPRGGTSVTGSLFSLHPDCFCYVAETHLVPLLFEFFEQAPLQGEKLELFASVLREQNRTVLLDMVQYNLEKGADPWIKVFEEKMIEELEQRILAYASSGLFGAGLVTMVMGEVAQIIRREKDRRVVGEKTPSNVFAAVALGLGSSVKLVSAVREPFASIASSKKRAADESDPYNGGFYLDIERNCGAYIDYLDAINKIGECAGMVVRYEDLQEDTPKAFGEMLKFVGLTVEPQAVDSALRRVRKKDSFDISKHYTPEEVWKITTLTREVGKPFGYAEQLSAMREALCTPTEFRDEFFPLGFWPIRGFDAPSTDGVSWLRRHGEAVIYAERAPASGRTSVALTIFSNFPANVLSGQPAYLSISSGGRVLWRHVVREGAHNARIVLELSEDDSVMINDSRIMYRLRFDASTSFRPSVSVKGGRDRRELSFSIGQATC